MWLRICLETRKLAKLFKHMVPSFNGMYQCNYITTSRTAVCLACYCSVGLACSCRLYLVFGVLTDKVFDAVEVAGRNVMSTTSVVTTELVSQR